MCNLIINASGFPGFSYKISDENSEFVINKFIEYIKAYDKYPTGLNGIEATHGREFAKAIKGFSIIIIVVFIIMIMQLLFF